MDVLIAESDHVVRRDLVSAVEAWGHQHAAVTSAEDAARLARRRRADALLLGSAPPGAEATAFAGEFRALASEACVSVIMLADRHSTPDPAALAGAGIDDILRLPLDVNELGIRLLAASRLLSLRRTGDRHIEEMRDLREELEMQNAQLAEAAGVMEMANHRFSELFAGLPIACFTYDAEGRVHEWNRACEALYKVSAADAFLKRISEVIAYGPRAEEDWKFARRVFAGGAIEGAERAVELPGGRVCHVLYSVFPLRRPDGQIVGAICAGVDISARKTAEAQVQEQMARINEYSAELELQKNRLEEANERLESLAVTDCLTGVGNHRAFRESLEMEYQRAVRHQRPLSLLLLDVDHFKDYNDAYGHPAGDAALQAVGRILADGARAGDAVARYGGEEFAVVLPDTDAERAMNAAERHRSSVAAHAFPGRQVTVSIGVASLSLSTPTREALIAQADAALYSAKTLGRNCAVHSADVSGESPWPLGSGRRALAPVIPARVCNRPVY